MPKFRTDIYKYSFNILTIKLINMFFYKFLIVKKTVFSNVFKVSINLFDYYTKFLNGLNS